MIKYLKANSHKGIKEIELTDLSKINIVCGKNNSGKTSVLESICNVKCYKVGIEFSHGEFLVNKLKVTSSGYSQPSRQLTESWLNLTIDKLLSQKLVIYSLANLKMIQI